MSPCAAQTVGFLGLFGLKTGVYILLFLVWNVWFSRNYGNVWTLYLSFQFQMNKNEKQNMRIRNAFEEFFCLRFNLRNDDIICA